MQNLMVLAIVATAAVYLLRSVVGWARRGGQSKNCPGCGSCAKPKKQPSALISKPNTLLSMIGLGKK